MTHIFYANSIGDARSICWDAKKSESKPLDDDGEVCKQCSIMAKIILTQTKSKVSFS